jgi:ATP-dependent exoDNAse (exonuclease V) beta subunit
LPHEYAVFVRSAAQLDRAQTAVKKSGLAFKILDEHVETTSSHVSISTMHLAKGLEFRAVVVMPATMRSSRCRSASRRSATTPTSMKCTKRSDTCSTSPALARVTIGSSRASNLLLSSSMT